LSKHKVLIAVIAFNEDKNIESVLLDLTTNNWGYDIIVINNGSNDNTTEICARIGIPVISHCINTGNSFGTVLTYFMYAFRNGYDIVCQFDGDGQHLAAELINIVNPIKDGDADYVIGSRFITGEGYQSYSIRRIVIKILSYIIGKILGYNITDITSGFRAYNTKVIFYFAKIYRKEIFDGNQLLLLSHYFGAKIKEVPVIMEERLHGESEFKLIPALAFPVEGIINILGCLLQSNNLRTLRGLYGNNN